MKLSCTACRKEFDRKKSQIEKYKTHFCSTRCLGKWRSKTGLLCKPKRGKNISCLSCSKTFYVRQSRLKKNKNHFCSTGCHYKWQRKTKTGYKTKKGKYIKCPVCNKEIYLRPGHKAKHPTCSYGCANKLRRKKRVYFNCDYCDKKHSHSPSTYNRSKKHFCSIECFYKFNVGKNCYQWKGERKTKSGYIIVRDYSGERKSGYIYKHRSVMQRHLKRELQKKEAVHHKNGIKTDNRIENLELIGSKDHAKLHNVKRKRDKRGRFI